MKEGRLAIKNMSFSYGGDALLFNNISLDLRRGECVSISGDHSCGKTTLLKLISGLYKPTKGDVLVNDAAATLYPARELVQHVGYLAMEGTIFKGTIQQNLTAFGEIPLSKVKEIMKLLDIEKDIAKLPAGFDTKLEGGTADPIPPGLKQRITIARVLASKPRILLFDNADRALDQHGYHHVYRLLARLKGKATIIIVSDDRNILRLAQKEYVLEGGHLIEREFSDRSKMHDVLPYQELRL
jgi:ATP-binding cassette subfamily C protein LapB